MNVTIKMSDEICREARHRAVDEGESLSGWVAGVIRKELSRRARTKRRTLLDSLGNEELSGVELDFPRDKSSIREADLS